MSTLLTGAFLGVLALFGLAWLADDPAERNRRWSMTDAMRGRDRKMARRL